MPQVDVRSLHNIHAFLDPGSGKRGQDIRATRARSALVVVGEDDDGHIFVLDSWADRVGTSEIVANVLRLFERWRPVAVGFEDQGQQHLLSDPVSEASMLRGYQIPLVPVQVSTKVDKNWRIRQVLQPLIGHGRLIIHDRLIELKSELVAFPMGRTKDLVDALASACAMLPPMAARNFYHHDNQAYAQYLRESGVGAGEIERLVAEAGGYQPGENSAAVWYETLGKLPNIRVRY